MAVLSKVELELFSLQLGAAQQLRRELQPLDVRCHADVDVNVDVDVNADVNVDVGTNVNVNVNPEVVGSNASDLPSQFQ